MTDGRNMVIAVDLLGGDKAPESNIEGSKKALEKGFELLALGDEESLEELKSKGDFPNLHTQVCREVIRPEESPVRAIRSKKDSTIVQGLMAVKTGKAGAFVSAGSTGALVAGGVLILGRAPGVDKPCLGTVLPTQEDNGVLFLDLGASSDVRPQTLVEFGLMGRIYAKKVLGWQNPGVALLNNGIEEDKGNALTKKAYELMKNAPLNFLGNIEARDVFSGKAQVVVADGFTGNVFLKTCEGTAMFQLAIIKKELSSSLVNKMAALILRPAFKRAKATLDYSAYGGAPLLGLLGGVVKCHGSSDGQAIFNGIKQAGQFVKENCASLISESLLAMGGQEKG